MDCCKPVIRPRRLRRGELMRSMLQRVRPRRSDLIVPVFVTSGAQVHTPIASMPGVYRYSPDTAVGWLSGLAERGLAAFLVFGVIERGRKDATGSEALNPENPVCQLLRLVREKNLPMLAMTDLCFCEYTDHGHCGPLCADGTVDNDATLELAVRQALLHAQCGADVIAPSGMMDGIIGALRRGLDSQGFADVALMSYAVKYASAFYGPFRDAAESAPQSGDRRGYQMDPLRGVEEALHEAMLDERQGADVLMVKPAMPYLDVLAQVRQRTNLPVAAYQVSGEYAMLQAAIAQGWLDERGAICESLAAIKRAGADWIITYFAERAANWLER